MLDAGYIHDLLIPNLINIDRFLTWASHYTGKRRDRRGRFASSEERVETPCVAWLEMAEDWQLVRDLRGGTRGMRLARERWLPKFPKESQGEYDRRLRSSFLIDMLGDLVDDLVAKPFSKAISFVGKPPEWVVEFMADVDGEGTTLQQFARNYLTDAMYWGLSHIAVDAVNLPTDLPPEPQNRHFEGARARWRLVPGPNMLSWSRATSPGRPIQEVRFYERVVDAYEVIELVHVWTAQQMTVHERDSNVDKFTEGETVGHAIGRLPIVTLYTKRTGEFTAQPPFLDVAWINVDHWASYSDQRQILHTARVPLLFRKGFSKDEILRGPQVIGARRIHSTSNTDADMRYVEPGGTAMNEGREHLKGLREEAAEKGARPLQSRGPVTATGEVRADEKSTCDLQCWAEDLERALLDALKLAQLARPGLEPIPDDFSFRVHSDFDLRDRTAADLQIIDGARARKDISRDAAMSEYKRHGVLPEDYDAKADKVLIDKEIAEGMDQEDDLADDEPGKPKGAPLGAKA